MQTAWHFCCFFSVAKKVKNKKKIFEEKKLRLDILHIVVVLHYTFVFVHTIHVGDILHMCGSNKQKYSDNFKVSVYIFGSLTNRASNLFLLLLFLFCYKYESRLFGNLDINGNRFMCTQVNASNSIFLLQMLMKCRRTWWNQLIIFVYAYLATLWNYSVLWRYGRYFLVDY